MIILVAVTAAILLLLICYLLIAKFSSSTAVSFGGKRVLLVTAHPDDECMFFGPTIVNVDEISKLYLLCCSPGKLIIPGFLS